MAKRIADITTTPYGEKVPTKKLAEQMRSYRGRLSRPNLCRAMGWPLTPQNLALVTKICLRWEIITADYVPEIAPVHFTAGSKIRMDKELDLAAANRVEQIRLAREEMKIAKPYKPSKLGWDDV